MIKEHDRVVLTEDVPEEGLTAGDVGTVVHIHNNGEGYEVEFMTLTGQTIAVASLLAPQVRPVSRQDEVQLTSSHKPMPIRAAVHTGEVEVVGDDIRGLAVHLASRLLALAGPGEILASATTRDLVDGSGLAFEDRGRHELKGIVGAREVYALSDA